MTEVKTEITNVTIFRDGARVTRTGKVTLDKGPQKAEIFGITEYASADSFRVKGKGPAKLSSIDDIKQLLALKSSDVIGVIIGQPLYSETLNLRELLKLLNAHQEIL